jgi:hypothetical protein
MSAFGAWPAVLEVVRRSRPPEAQMRALERMLPGTPRRLRWLAWICGAQLALMLLLDLILFFPHVFVNGLPQ